METLGLFWNIFQLPTVEGPKDKANDDKGFFY